MFADVDVLTLILCAQIVLSVQLRSMHRSFLVVVASVILSLNNTRADIKTPFSFDTGAPLRQ